MYQLVKIGWSKLVGEVIKLEKDTVLFNVMKIPVVLL